jgi:hypothetical protein
LYAVSPIIALFFTLSIFYGIKFSRNVLPQKILKIIGL